MELVLSSELKTFQIKLSKNIAYLATVLLSEGKIYILFTYIFIIFIYIIHRGIFVAFYRFVSAIKALCDLGLFCCSANHAGIVWSQLRYLHSKGKNRWWFNSNCNFSKTVGSMVGKSSGFIFWRWPSVAHCLPWLPIIRTLPKPVVACNCSWIGTGDWWYPGKKMTEIPGHRLTLGVQWGLGCASPNRISSNWRPFTCFNHRDG